MVATEDIVRMKWWFYHLNQLSPNQLQLRSQNPQQFIRPKLTPAPKPHQF
ncbi:hypothetical protein MKW92_020613 [Papaver armeniacum]|nr:hypothetical protein MKW92_020613 [Papaver armeniacum]